MRRGRAGARLLCVTPKKSAGEGELPFLPKVEAGKGRTCCLPRRTQKISTYLSGLNFFFSARPVQGPPFFRLVSGGLRGISAYFLLRMMLKNNDILHG